MSIILYKYVRILKKKYYFCIVKGNYSPIIYLCRARSLNKCKDIKISENDYYILF